MTAKSDVIVKLALVFFISLLSFSIGTFVGKKYSDNQHKLAQLEPAKGEEQRTVASEHGEEPNHNPTAMTDDEIAKLAEEFVADDSAEQEHGKTAKNEHGEAKADEHGEAAGHDEAKKDEPAVAAKDDHSDSHGTAKAETHEKAEAKHETKPVVAAHKEEKQEAKKEEHHEPLAVAKHVAEGKAPTELKAANAVANDKRKPSSLPKDVAQYSVGKFTVQVASFNTEDEAKKRAGDLKDQGYSAFYVPTSIKGKTWYRVSVGLFATEKEAKEYKATKKMDSAIVQKIAN